MQCSVPNTQTRCTSSWTVGGKQTGRGGRQGARKEGGGREQEEGWREGGGREHGDGGGREQEEGEEGRERAREETMMLGRQRASVEVEGRKPAEEGLSEEGREQWR